MVVERVSSPDNGPSRLWYVLAGAIVAVGFSLMAALLIWQLPYLTKGMQRVVMPGEASLILEPGTYTIFNEYRTQVDGKFYSGAPLDGLVLKIVGPNGSELDLDEPMSSRYSVGGRHGVAAYAFTVTEPGPHTLKAKYEEGGRGYKVVLAVGQGFVTAILVLVFGCLSLVFGSIGIAAAIAVPVHRKRRDARRLALLAQG